MTRTQLVQGLLVGVILLLSVVLRFHQYDVYPQRGATSDEYTYSFLGISLLTKGVPISWSTFPVYPNPTPLTIRGIYFPIVSPYFDHPPLYGLVVGGWALLFGETTFQSVQLSVIRIVPILLGLFSSVLVFLIGKKLYDFKTAVWSLLIYTTTTLFVMNMRVSVSENFLTAIFLSASYIWILRGGKLSVRTVIMLGMLSGMAIWTKMLGIAAGISSAFLLFAGEYSWKKRGLFIGVFGLCIVLLFGYGWYYDLPLFLRVFFSQAGRNIGPETLRLLMTTPVVVNKVYYDGWYFFGLISLFAASGNYIKHKALLVPAVVYFLLLLTSMTKEGHTGWYAIPLYPYMSLLGAALLVESLKRKNFYMFVVLLFVGMSQIASIFEVQFGLTGTVFRILSYLLFLPFFITFFLKKDTAYRAVGDLYFYLLICGNIFLTYTYVHPA